MSLSQKLQIETLLDVCLLVLSTSNLAVLGSIPRAYNVRSLVRQRLYCDDL